jgi:hypothetical protein
VTCSVCRIVMKDKQVYVTRRQCTGRSVISVSILDDGRKFLPPHPHWLWDPPVLMSSGNVAGARS